MRSSLISQHLLIAESLSSCNHPIFSMETSDFGEVKHSAGLCLLKPDHDSDSSDSFLGSFHFSNYQPVK